jgi:hypothetical protein
MRELAVLHTFTGTPDGALPYGTLIRDTNGNLDGTTLEGGVDGVGTVFKLTKSGKESVLYSLTGGANGESPYAGVIRDPAGNLYVCEELLCSNRFMRLGFE